MAWRYIATRLRGDGTEEILEWNVPLADPKITKTLSGPDGLSGTIRPEVVNLKAADGSPLIEPWSTALYAEVDGHIRCGGIVSDTKARGDTFSVDALGFAGYPAGMPYLGSKDYKNTDPTAVVKDVWDYLQAQKGGNLGLVVNLPATPIRTGTRLDTDEQSRNPDNGQYVAETTPAAISLRFDKTHDLGQVIADAVKATPFDYIEQHTWASDRVIRHELIGGYPRLGRRRTDLRFVVGENVFELPDATAEGDAYASEVLVLGAGEGSKMVRTHLSRPTTRLRRAAVVTDRSLTSVAAANLRANAELASRTGELAISELTLLDHPHAPIGSYSLGDELFVHTGPAGWQGDMGVWVRLVELTYSPENLSVAVLKVMPVVA